MTVSFPQHSSAQALKFAGQTQATPQVVGLGRMTDLAALLTFPSVSNGFSALHSATHGSHTTWSSLPLTKVARLDADSDSASASRSRAGVHPTPQAVVRGGPVRVCISGSRRECPLLFQTAEYNQSSSQSNRIQNTKSMDCFPS